MGGAGPARGGTQGPRGGARHPVLARDAAGRRYLGRPVLERDGVSPRLLPEVPPLREVLSPLGPGGLPDQHGMRGSEVAGGPALSVRLLEGLGGTTLDGLQHLGRFGRFLGEAVAIAVVPPFKLGRTVERLSFIGYRSLVIVVLTGAFTGMVLGLQVS